MVTHPNRSKTPRPKARPTAAQVCQARKRAGHSLSQAAAVIHGTVSGWRKWEEGARGMHPAFFELYLIKTQQLTLGEVTT